MERQIRQEDRRYRLGFRQAYTDRVRSRRRRAALVVGAAATAVLGVLTYGAYQHLR